MCIIRADIWTDTIFANSQFRKFMGRPSAEAGMIRQPLIIQTSALPIELPALCQLTEILHVYQRAIVLLSRIRLSVHTAYVLLMGS